MSVCLGLVLLGPLCQDVAPVRERAVDYVSVRNEQPLFGIVLEHDGKRPTVMAVQRKWLQASQPARYERFRQQELQRESKQTDVLVSRIRAWMRERKGDEDLLKYLQEQLDKLTARVANPKNPTTQFMLIQLDPDSVRRVQRPKREARQVVWLAYRDRLADIETRSAESLFRELQQKGVTWPKEPVNLSTRIPSGGDNEVQWAARQAIIEQLYRKPIKMKGTPELLFRDLSDGKPADTQAMIAQMMNQRLETLLRDLTQPGGAGTSRKWLRQAQQEAKKTDSRAVHVTLVHPDVSMRQAVVEAFLLGRMPDGSWRIVWQTRSAVVPDARPELEERIREDEQVAALLKTLGGLGQQGAVDKAIRFGAATMEAQQAVQASYVKWRDPFYDDLRGPAIKLPQAGQ